MQIETVEQRCLTYLQQVSNPIVPLSRLLAYLRQFPDCRDVDEGDLTDFLAKHELFRVFNPLPVDPHQARALGISTDRRVILTTRVPTRAEARASMNEMLDSLGRALGTALREANERDDDELRRKAEHLMRRIEKIRADLAVQ
ncbi:MAG TPA: hypothetical protein P5318_03295 [Candidatus Hydrogenedentes bacterium]|nr:hypothetical protein [Candidatus Hydrogenedentota bacterium]HRT19126.1 hypothetical protein [Candidatus Hydrogenedentota bacterium]HRT64055.1 hypothetical protein [Candidatus Hydrogenedentota bacterium]